ncbi:MAG: Fe(3+) dicitrate ABC transporter substrate-binding protein [Haemophilus parainfluenzae]|jgi:kpLE2 phage-like element; iron-dicitrate transporter subunit (fecb)|uniref:Fe(3+) dicitrate ABC transporter substrate-binding protein n=1 Tax=Haemophilus parainfluenzae TaxID=729 RepID=UPI00066A8011|nr:Fe(3+) dicitrate ABC transporter substrate-binding protein [Haemophilus parainfluenzae]MBF1224990.1 ABC transporter substrate-binding protein [Haemophilus parainfluenzae]MDU2562596.1 Fe(3+) dicitrate ABC transporter substrate-binding protein [Haemophilus parainfluenzae]MDU4439656.1 Fe(3+) dicitrate ABC transporter substrate-binding protein [Haemophilus parainfluenzae]MDU4497329.1 Fe(3+) dicitrate ABC transporter substrate-binding protein [Haemophilus parainfluenzae]MDU5793640.1 Fe(3+) dicit
MKKLLKTTLASALLMASAFASAVTVKDAKGEFTLDKTPSRVVALEYSFVDALAQVGVSPVGVADDNKIDRILPQVREKIAAWQSVGTRSQPSLEVIASLKPDLIIADPSRHTAVFEELKKIAPTVMFDSRHESYQENLETAQKIGDLVGKSSEMKAKINEHNDYIANIAKNLGVQGKKASFGTSREDKFNIQNDNGYVGSFLTTLGFAPTKLNSDQAFVEINLEQLVMEKPEYLFIAHYRDESIARKWEAEPLWKAIPAVKANHVYSVDSDMWARGRGLEASKIMAKQIEGFVKQK